MPNVLDAVPNKQFSRLDNAKECNIVQLSQILIMTSR